MEIKRYEYKLKYGPADFLLDVLPPFTAVLLNMKIAGCGLSFLAPSLRPLRRIIISAAVSAAIVFSLIFLYEIIEQIVTGSFRKVRIEICSDCILIRFGCRCRYFRKGDIHAFDFDTKRKKLTFILTRCLEKRRGIFSYIRLFTGRDPEHSSCEISDYLAPLVTGGMDSLKIGLPDPPGRVLLNPFVWTPVSQLQVIEKEGIFDFTIPCDSVSTASGIISGILGRDISAIFGDL